MFNTVINLFQVGPGTGCAPFRSLIQSRLNTPQQLLLFFGCRGEHRDYFFRDEWETPVKFQETNSQGELEANTSEEERCTFPITGSSCLQVITAFSRDQDRKIYVQHRIVECGQLVWRLLGQGAVFCVAGNIICSCCFGSVCNMYTFWHNGRYYDTSIAALQSTW